MDPAPDVTDRSLTSLLSLAARTAVVTGGGRGIGAATAVRLAEAGAAVGVLDLDGDAAEAQAKEVAGRHRVDAIGVAVDVTDPASISVATDRVVDALGPVDVWVNNAGVYPAAPLLEMSEEQWDAVLDVNLRGVFLGSREAGRRMTAAGRRGVIVNIASVSGLRSSRGGRGHYVASKHGVVGLTKAFAVELGPLGIRVLAVAPSTVDTPGLAAEKAAQPAASAWLDQLAQSLPLRRGGVPDDIARVVVFCACDLAVLMTGCTLPVDAGHDCVM